MSFGKFNLLALVLVKLAAGDQFQVRLNQTSSADTKVGSRQTLIENATTLEMGWNVLKVVKGTAVIEQSILGISLDVNNPAVPIQAVSFDTSASDEEAKEYSKPSKALLKQIKPLIGLKFNVMMAESGEIKEVTLPPASAEIINQLPDTVRLRQLFSPQGLTEILGASAILFPEKAIESGGSWSDDKPVTTPLGAFTRKRIYTLVGKKTVDGKELTEIQMEPTLVPKQAAEKEESVQSSLDAKLISFSGSGTLLVDAENGYLKSSSFENELKSERPYREKTIQTAVKNQILMTINKLGEEK